MLKNRRGGTLFSVMVLAGILGVVTMAGIGVFSNRMQSARYTVDRLGAIDLLERIRLTTISVDSCSNMVAGGPPPVNVVAPGTLSRASVDLGSETVVVGMNGNVNITQLQFVPEAVLPQTFDAAGILRNHRRMRLDVAGEVLSNGRRFAFQKSFPFDALLNGNLVTGCYRGQNVDLVACEVMAGAGTFTSPPKNCAMPVKGITTGACPAGQCICGFTATNTVMCRSTAGGGACTPL